MNWGTCPSSQSRSTPSSVSWTSVIIVSRRSLQQISSHLIGTSCSRKNLWLTHYSIACSITASPFASRAHRYAARSLLHPRQILRMANSTPLRSSRPGHHRVDATAESRPSGPLYCAPAYTVRGAGTASATEGAHCGHNDSRRALSPSTRAPDGAPLRALGG